MKVGRKALEHLLKATMREQHINGKLQQQVSSCVLVFENGVVSTTSIVKDGRTSLSRFSFKVSDEESEAVYIPVPEIERLLGVLKYHGDCVKLTYYAGKVKIKSKSKQTTLVGGFKAKAYANSQEDINERYRAAVARAEQIDGNQYKLAAGGIVRPFCTVTLPSSDLYDAFRCDGMNGQKMNRYVFEANGKSLSVSVGDVFKGMTNTTLCDYESKEFTSTFEGGLENIFKHYSGEVKISFLDFTEYGQAISIIMQFTNGDWVYQAGVLNV